MAGSQWIFRGDGGLGRNAPLGKIWQLAVDAGGNVYAADIDNHIVVRVEPSGILTVVAGNGFRGFSGDGGAATSASFNRPRAEERGWFLRSRLAFAYAATQPTWMYNALIGN